MLSGKYMPETPKGHKRPADVISNAVQVMRIATGEAEEQAPTSNKNAAAVELGKLGGRARAKKLSKKKLKAIAASGAKARWDRDH
jgi:hypothetical protein